MVHIPFINQYVYYCVHRDSVGHNTEVKSGQPFVDNNTSLISKSIRITRRSSSQSNLGDKEPVKPLTTEVPLIQPISKRQRKHSFNSLTSRVLRLNTGKFTKICYFKFE